LAERQRKKRRKTEVDTGRVLMEYYEALYSAFGPQKWWPGSTRFEVMVGAILTQNTAWSNVEKAIANLRGAGVLTPRGLHELPTEELARLIRPSGYFNIKARRLKNFIDFLFTAADGSVARLFGTKDSALLRRSILAVKGIGPETADSMLLYAGRRPEFVVDAYTKRVLTRHGLVEDKAGYEEIKELFMKNLEEDTALFNEYHALFVKLGKDYCRPRNPLCKGCPLRDYLPR